MSLTRLHTQNLIQRLEETAKQSIREIEATHLPQSRKNEHKAEILRELLRDRTELELQAIRTDLALTKDPKAMMAEIEWAERDMKSDRCPEFLRDLFEKHVFEMSAMNFQTEANDVAIQAGGSQSPT